MAINDNDDLFQMSVGQERAEKLGARQSEWQMTVSMWCRSIKMMHGEKHGKCRIKKLFIPALPKKVRLGYATTTC